MIDLFNCPEKIGDDQKRVLKKLKIVGEKKETDKIRANKMIREAQ